jgi:hypothetical protein
MMYARECNVRVGVKNGTMWLNEYITKKGTHKYAFIKHYAYASACVRAFVYRCFGMACIVNLDYLMLMRGRVRSVGWRLRRLIAYKMKGAAGVVQCVMVEAKTQLTGHSMESRGQITLCVYVCNMTMEDGE